ncbi:MAG: polysulfide reductase NrfD, partial [Chloroflexi bacterium]|nr:polysulfide reductase NrfD [Chloroflexota bacterium]
MTWGIWIALYLFLAGAGAGAFITAATAEALHRPEFRPLMRGGLLISGPLVA